MQIGSMPAEYAQKSMRMFAKKVMPSRGSAEPRLRNGKIEYCSEMRARARGSAPVALIALPPRNELEVFRCDMREEIFVRILRQRP